jgi:hypothetical protein
MIRDFILKFHNPGSVNEEELSKIKDLIRQERSYLKNAAAEGLFLLDSPER